MPLSSATAPHSASSAEIMLFGVRVVVDSMRKSVSMNNLSQYDHHRDTAAAAKDDAAGYASADDAAPNNSGKNRDRKRGIPWTEEEHKLFLVGLQKVGKGDWRGISRNYVKTRTPTQVASHAQKYFLRRTNFNRRRRRSSLFDITTDSVSSVQVSTTPMEEGEIQHEDNVSLVHPMYPVTGEGSNMNGFSMLPMYSKDIAEAGNPMKILTLGQGNNVEQNGPCTKLVCTTPPIVPASDITATSLSSVDPPTLSLGLSLSSTQRQTSSIHSAFHSLSRFNNGDSVITVA